MTQRTIFIYGLIAVALVLFAIRIWLVNPPEPVAESQPVATRTLPEGTDRALELRANEPGWKAVGRGPITIKAAGMVDIGGMQAAPDDQKRPGDDKALVPDLPYGMLVGKVGENGPAFRIGKLAQIAMKETVYLAINDADYSDNSGAYMITLTGGTKY